MRTVAPKSVVSACGYSSWEYRGKMLLLMDFKYFYQVTTVAMILYLLFEVDFKETSTGLVFYIS